MLTMPAVSKWEYDHLRRIEALARNWLACDRAEDEYDGDDEDEHYVLIDAEGDAKEALQSALDEAPNAPRVPPLATVTKLVRRA